MKTQPYLSVALLVSLQISLPAQGTNLRYDILKIENPQPTSRDGFGHSISASGEMALIGAPEGATKTGSVYVLESTGSRWKLTDELDIPLSSINDQFGFDVAVEGINAIVGAPGRDVPHSDSGAVFGYELDSLGKWGATQSLDPSMVLQAGERYGAAVALGSQWAAVGAPGRDSNGGIDNGGVYLFRRVGNAWVYDSLITSGSSENHTGFGRTISVSGSTLLVGSPTRNNGVYLNAGRVFVYDLSGPISLIDEWTHMSTQNGEQFGSAVRVVGDRAFVGVPRWREPASTNQTGAVHTYVRDPQSGTWSLDEVIWPSADGVAGDHFGSAIACNGERLLVGARNHAIGGVLSSGAAYLFEFDHTSTPGWISTRKFAASDGEADDTFGFALDLTNSAAVVGAYQEEASGIQDSGSLYMHGTVDCISISIVNPVAGSVGTLNVAGGTPGATVAFLWSDKMGSSSAQFSSWCGSLDLQVPSQSVASRIVFAGMLDAFGKTARPQYIPPNLAGRRFFFQALERNVCPEGCVSNLLGLDF